MLTPRFICATWSAAESGASVALASALTSSSAVHDNHFI
jgi:hypothetical protein